MSNLITKQQAIDAIGEIHPLDYNAQAIKARIEQLPTSEPMQIRVNHELSKEELERFKKEMANMPIILLPFNEPLTDIEQRIFLAAMSKEEKVCRIVDKEGDGDVNLTKVCKEIERKVKGALWS